MTNSFFGSALKKLVGDPFGTSGIAFERGVYRLANQLRMEVIDVDRKDKSALIALSGDARGYQICLGTTEEGKTFLAMSGNVYWGRRVPQIATEVAKRLDASSRRVLFKVSTFSSGKSKIGAYAIVPPLEDLMAEEVAELVSEMASKICTTDQWLIENGYVEC
jgi:hypothetical protein